MEDHVREPRLLSAGGPYSPAPGPRPAGPSGGRSDQGRGKPPLFPPWTPRIPSFALARSYRSPLSASLDPPLPTAQSWNVRIGLGMILGSLFVGSIDPITACGICGYTGMNLKTGCGLACKRLAMVIPGSRDKEDRPLDVNNYPIPLYTERYPYDPRGAPTPCLMGARGNADQAFKGRRLVVCARDRLREPENYLKHMATILEPQFTRELASHLGLPCPPLPKGEFDGPISPYLLPGHQPISTHATFHYIQTSHLHPQASPRRGPGAGANGLGQAAGLLPPGNHRGGCDPRLRVTFGPLPRPARPNHPPSKEDTSRVSHVLLSGRLNGGLRRTRLRPGLSPRLTQSVRTITLARSHRKRPRDPSPPPVRWVWQGTAWVKADQAAPQHAPIAASFNPGTQLAGNPGPFPSPSASTFAAHGQRRSKSNQSGIYKALLGVTTVVGLVQFLSSQKAPYLGPRAQEDTSPPSDELVARYPRLLLDSFQAGSMTKAGEAWLSELGRDNKWAQQVHRGVGWAFDTEQFGPYPGDPTDPKNVYSKRWETRR